MGHKSPPVSGLAGWRYWKLGPPGTYLWRDPHGLLYLRTRDGTRALE